jgi:hypothetical protein
MVVAPLRVT